VIAVDVRDKVGLERGIVEYVGEGDFHAVPAVVLGGLPGKQGIEDNLEVLRAVAKIRSRRMKA
jgi:hypothetical protein